MPIFITPSTSKVTGLLSCISDVEKIEAEKIADQLKFRGDLEIISNQLGNLLLYPQTIPSTEIESSFNLAVLKEILRLEPGNFYTSNLKKIYIPDICTYIFPNLPKLAFIFIDYLKPVNLTSFFLRSENLGMRNLGTYIKPEKITNDYYLDIFIADKQFHILAGKISIIVANAQKVDLKLQSNYEIIPGKKELNTEVVGGELGLIVDLCN